MPWEEQLCSSLYLSSIVIGCIIYMTACIYFLSYTQLHNLWEQVAFIQNKFTNDTDL